MECAKSIKITEGHWTEKVYKSFVAENAELGPVLKSSRNAWDMSVPCMIAGGTLGGILHHIHCLTTKDLWHFKDHHQQ